MPQISVIMSTYNERSEELKIAIESILNQTFKNFEFIIILDNPRNNDIKELLVNYQKIDSRVKLIFNEKNIGLAQSLNKGIEIASAPLIARMDADDISFPTRFEEQYEYMNNNKDCGVLGTHTILLYDNTEGDENKQASAINKCMCIEKLFLCGNLLAHPTVMFRTDIVKAVGGYRDFKAAQDYDLWLRLIKKGVKFSVIEKPLLYYRIREKSITQSNRAKQRAYDLYAKYLFKNEVEGTELFGEVNRDEFFEKIHLKTQKEQDRFNKAIRISEKSYKHRLNGQKAKGVFLKLYSFLLHKEVFVLFFNNQKQKFIMRIYRRK